MVFPEHDMPTSLELNRRYQRVEDLPDSLWLELAGLDPSKVCERAGSSFLPDQEYVVPFMEKQYYINCADRSIFDVDGCAPRFQLGLVLINYLLRVSESGLAGEMITARELNGGELFFKGPHALRVTPVIDKFGVNPEGFLKRARVLGGSQIPGGDASVRFLVLPKILVSYILYAGDEEFPASLTITLDANADQHLPLDAIWAMINVISDRIAEV